MRHVVTWHQVTTYSAELEVTIPELAKWAIAHAPVALLSVDGSTQPEPSVLERSLELNMHLRARLLQLYADHNNRTIRSQQPHPIRDATSGHRTVIKKENGQQKTKTHRRHYDDSTPTKSILRTDRGESS